MESKNKRKKNTIKSQKKIFLSKCPFERNIKCEKVGQVLKY